MKKQAGSTVYLCRGQDCRQRRAFLEALRLSLPEDQEVINVRCQKICKGAVVGVRFSGRLLWFRKLKSKKDLIRLRVLIEKGKLSKGLKKKRSKKRTGRLRT